MKVNPILISHVIKNVHWIDHHARWKDEDERKNRNYKNTHQYTLTQLSQICKENIHVLILNVYIYIENSHWNGSNSCALNNFQQKLHYDLAKLGKKNCKKVLKKNLNKNLNLLFAPSGFCIFWLFRITKWITSALGDFVLCEKYRICS